MDPLTKLFFVASLAVVSLPALSQRPTWNTVTPGNMEWSNTPGSHPTTIYNQIGPFTYGSDGSRGYTPGRESSPYVEPPPPAAGNRGVIQGDTFLEYDPGGTLVRRCTRLAGRVTCTSP